MKNKFINLFSILLLLLIPIIIYLAWPWILLYIGINSEPNPPRPEIIYGEFPFRLVYEINGETREIQDTLICEYDGVGSDEASGKYRKWKQRLASGNERITLLKTSDEKEIFFVPGSPEYYMDDMDGSKENNSGFPNAAYIKKEGRFTTEGFVRAEQLLKEYQIKLISWDDTQPIKNSYISSNK